ncbi:MAG TPA: YhjD/YihY/BrkB family envelope integrity protein, partial [Polyangiaceae bacterium]|nr:YhjD/YihY/BrkB family envelope integrity protein [Polyangiaceae bacterium]
GGVLRRAWRIFSTRDARFLGAAVAFYALLSAAPLFVVILYVVGSIFGREQAESALWGGLSNWLAPAGLKATRALTERLARTEASSGMIGTALVLYGSTRLFRGLHRALNLLWGVDDDGDAPVGALTLAARHGGAFLLTLFASGLVALLLVIKAGFALLAAHGAGKVPGLLWVLDEGTSIALAFALFCALFRLLPEAPVTWREAALSALVSTPLFALGSALVSLYLRQRPLGDLYGRASAVVLAVVWVYYSAQVFFFGACIGAAMSERARAPG